MLMSWFVMFLVGYRVLLTEILVDYFTTRELWASHPAVSVDFVTNYFGSDPSICCSISKLFISFNFFLTSKTVFFTLAHFRCGFDESAFLNATPTFYRLLPSKRRWMLLSFLPQFFWLIRLNRGSLENNKEKGNYLSSPPSLRRRGQPSRDNI